MFKKTAALSIFTAVLCFLMMVSAFAVVPPEAEGAVQISLEKINVNHAGDDMVIITQPVTHQLYQSSMYNVWAHVKLLMPLDGKPGLYRIAEAHTHWGEGYPFDTALDDTMLVLSFHGTGGTNGQNAIDLPVDTVLALHNVNTETGSLSENAMLYVCNGTVPTEAVGKIQLTFANVNKQVGGNESSLCTDLSIPRGPWQHWLLLKPVNDQNRSLYQLIDRKYHWGNEYWENGSSLSDGMIAVGFHSDGADPSAEERLNIAASLEIGTCYALWGVNTTAGTLTETNPMLYQVPAPAPAPLPVLPTPSNVAYNGLTQTASWDAVEGTASYQVTLYAGENSVETADVNASATTHTFGITYEPNTSYSVTVQAIGAEGVNTNSAVSEKSAAFVTPAAAELTLDVMDKPNGSNEAVLLTDPADLSKHSVWSYFLLLKPIDGATDVYRVVETHGNSGSAQPFCSAISDGMIAAAFHVVWEGEATDPDTPFEARYRIATAMQLGTALKLSGVDVENGTLNEAKLTVRYDLGIATEQQPLNTPANLQFITGTASWDAVPGAASYKIRLYEGETELTEKEVVTSETRNDFSESLGNEEKTYAFTVEAIPLDSPYLKNSAMSEKSAAFTVPAGGFNQTFDITASTTEGGILVTEDTMPVRYGGTVTYTIVPKEGYLISDVLVDGVSVGAVSSYAFTNVDKAHTIAVTFAKMPSDDHTTTQLTFENTNALPGASEGSLFTDYSTFEEGGWRYSMMLVPMEGKAGIYKLVETVDAAQNFTTLWQEGMLILSYHQDYGERVALAQSISVGANLALWGVNTETGKITQSNPMLYVRNNIYEEPTIEKLDTPTGLRGSSWTASWNAVDNATGYTVRIYRGNNLITTKTVKTTSCGLGQYLDYSTSYTFTVEAVGQGPFFANSAVSAKSARYTTPAFDWSTVSYPFSATAGVGGTITPSGNRRVTHRDSITYTITPDEGYTILSVTDNGIERGPITELVYTDVMSSHKIVVTFAKEYTEPDCLGIDLVNVQHVGNDTVLITNPAAMADYYVNWAYVMLLEPMDEQNGCYKLVDAHHNWGTVNTFSVPIKDGMIVLSVHASGNDAAAEKEALAMGLPVGTVFILQGVDIGNGTKTMENAVLYTKDTTWENPFTDVNELDPYYAAVKFGYKKNLFVGTSETTFAPDMTMTRGMFVTVLGRLAGIDPQAYTNITFDDVKIGEWYTPYVAWAAEEGIIFGYGNGKFGVEDMINNEQAAVILARYAEYTGMTVDANASLDMYADADSISDWAAEHMAWAVENGIYVGSGENLHPQEWTARSLVAEMMYAYIKGFETN